MMGIMYLLVKGVLASTVGLIQLPYCKKTLKVDGTSCQTMGVISHAPWAMKGTIGVLSDSYPLLGYHKNSYILLAAGLGTASFLCLALFPGQSVAAAALFLMLGIAEISVADLLCEGQYAALMKAKPESGNSMVSLVWGCCMAGVHRASVREQRDSCGAGSDYCRNSPSTCLPFFVGPLSLIWTLRYLPPFPLSLPSPCPSLALALDPPFPVFLSLSLSLSSPL